MCVLILFLFDYKCYLVSMRKIFFLEFSAHPTNPVEGCADANPKTELPNDT